MEPPKPCSLHYHLFLLWTYNTCHKFQLRLDLLEHHYSFMGSHDLLVEEAPSCVIVHPRTGRIDTIISIRGSPRKAEFSSSDASGVRFAFNGTNYVVRYDKKSD